MMTLVEHKNVYKFNSPFQQQNTIKKIAGVCNIKPFIGISMIEFKNFQTFSELNLENDDDEDGFEKGCEASSNFHEIVNPSNLSKRLKISSIKLFDCWKFH